MSTSDVVDLSGPRYDLPIRRGVSFVADAALTYEDDDGVHTAGDPVDLTDVTLAGQIRKASSSSEIVATIAFTVTDAAAGEFTIEIDKDDTELLTAARYVWDATFEDEDGVRLAMWQGDVIVKPWVTR